VNEVLARATELERVDRLERAGLSDAELAALAKESGLDVSVLRRAAQDVAARRAAKTNGFFGAPTRQTFERIVDGELRAEQHEQLAAEILDAVRGLASFSGQLTAVGRTLSWSGMTTGGMVSISVIPRDGKTVIRVEVSASQLAGGLFGGLMGGIGGGVGANVGWILPTALHLPVVAGIAGALAVTAGAWALARAVFRSRVGRVYGTMAQLTDRLDQRTRQLLAR
jgi:hypothetical protein